MSLSRGEKAFGAWFIFCGLLGLAWLSFLIWAIARVVLHFT